MDYKDNFKIYLIKLSDDIISNYKNIIILEKQKRKNNEHYLPISSEKINYLLVQHLAYELDVEPSDLNKWIKRKESSYHKWSSKGWML